MESIYLVGIDPDKVQLALVLTSDRFESLDDLLPLGVARFDEDVGQGDTSLCVGSKVIGRDFVEKRYRVLLCENEESIVRDGAREFVATFIESLVEDDSGGLDVGGSGDSRISRETEEVIVSVEISEVVEGGLGSLVGLVGVSDNDDLVGSLEFVVVR